MGKILRSKFRVLTLVSLAFLTQCCCCILPVGWQVREQNPGIQATIQQIEDTLQIDLGAVESYLISAR